MTGLLCSTQFSGGKAGRSLGCRVWSEDSILCGAGVDTEQWPLQGSGEELPTVLSCHVYNIPHNRLTA